MKTDKNTSLTETKSFHPKNAAKNAAKILIALVIMLAVAFQSVAAPHRHTRHPHSPHVVHHVHHRVTNGFGMGFAVGAVSIGALTSIALSQTPPTVVRVWIPGHWNTTVNSFGQTMQVWVEGHWEIHRN